MTTNEIILAVVTAVLVVFSLTVALVIPKRDPDFPGRRGLAVFFLVSVVLVLGVLASVELITEEEAEAGEVAEPSAGEPPGAPRPGDPAVGEGVFLGSAGCGSCHTLAAAGTTGTIGPNLDEAKPPYELVIDRVTNGQGIMPSFAEELGEDQIQDVAAYVVQATSG
jgi:cytochrome c553